LRIQRLVQESTSPSPGDTMKLTPDLWRQSTPMRTADLKAMPGNCLEQRAKRFMNKQ
jgi:hypothetical protein